MVAKDEENNTEPIFDQKIIVGVGEAGRFWGKVVRNIKKLEQVDKNKKIQQKW